MNLENGPMSGRLAKPLTNPQSGVFTVGLGDTTGGPGAPLTLAYLPLADDSFIRILCDGVLTLRGRPPGADPLRELLGARGFGHTVLLSLEKIVGAETSGISWLYTSAERFNAAGGRMILHTVPSIVHSLLTILEMELPFQMAGSEAEARALALAGRPV